MYSDVVFEYAERSGRHRENRAKPTRLRIQGGRQPGKFGGSIILPQFSASNDAGAYMYAPAPTALPGSEEKGYVTQRAKAILRLHYNMIEERPIYGDAGVSKGGLKENRIQMCSTSSG